ncbi:hypothetical protein E2C01_066364 [Portunus trituberculatus]|uniref:Uncharacterized protein n=1 Tax=Portunus trituberculatus TaxID=210409 RepID=A0A5B7HGV8_PORTR|nr:hypothetical protein [Portunus trituberculatus]
MEQPLRVSYPEVPRVYLLNLYGGMECNSHLIATSLPGTVSPRCTESQVAWEGPLLHEGYDTMLLTALHQTSEEDSFTQFPEDSPLNQTRKVLAGIDGHQCRAASQGTRATKTSSQGSGEVSRTVNDVPVRIVDAPSPKSQGNFESNQTGAGTSPVEANSFH